MRLKTEIGRDFLAAAAASREARAGRWIWAGAVANGLTLIAFIGMIGNVADPDAALRFLLLPLGVYVLGVVFGGVAGHTFAKQADVDLELAADMATAEAAQPVLTSDDIFELQGAGSLICNRCGHAYGEIPKTVVEARARVIEAFKALTEKSKTLGQARQRYSDQARRLTYASFASLIFATGVIAWRVERGERLQPEQPKPAPAAQTTAGSPPTSPSAPVAKSPRPSPPPDTPAPPPRKSEPQGAASPPAADRKADRV